MTDTTPADPLDHDVAEPSPAPAPSRSVGALVLLVVLVVGLVLCAVGLVVSHGRAEDLQADEDHRQAAATTAARFGEAYLTYDFDDVDGSSDKVLALSTKDFAKDFADTRAPGIEQLFANLKTSTEATTTSVYLSDVTDEEARALVVVDVTADSSASGPQKLTDLAFVVTMVPDGDGDGWLVDDVTPAPQPNVAGGPASSTTSTTAPE